MTVTVTQLREARRGPSRKGRGTSPARLALVLVSLLSFPAGSVRAYVRTTTEAGKPMKWGYYCIPIQVYSQTPPRHLTTEKLLDAVTQSALTWSNDTLACSQLRLQVSSISEDSAPVAFDKKNRITFRRDAWCKEPRKATEPCYDPQALAITSVFARTKDGTIVDADMEINATNFTWDDLLDPASGSTPRGAQDLQNAVTHELGHLIGLDHTCYAPSDRPRPKDHLGRDIPDCSCFGPNGRPPQNPAGNCANATAEVGEATMFVSVTRGDTSRRDLSNDDAVAACQIYPDNGDLQCSPAPEDGGCRVAGLAGARQGTEATSAWVLLAIGALGGALSVRRRRQGQSRARAKTRPGA